MRLVKGVTPTSRKSCHRFQDKSPLQRFRVLGGLPDPMVMWTSIKDAGVLAAAGSHTARTQMHDPSRHLRPRSDGELITTGLSAHHWLMGSASNPRVPPMCSRACPLCGAPMMLEAYPCGIATQLG